MILWRLLSAIVVPSFFGSMCIAYAYLVAFFILVLSIYNPFAYQKTVLSLNIKVNQEDF